MYSFPNLEPVHFFSCPVLTVAFWPAFSCVSFLPCFSLLFFLQLFVKCHQTTTLLPSIYFSLEWVWSLLLVHCYKPLPYHQFFFLHWINFENFFSAWLISQSIQSLSYVRLFVTPWKAALQASLFITNSRSLLKLIARRVSDVIQPSHPLSSPSPPAPNPYQHQGLFNESMLLMRWPSIGVSASASVLPMNTQDWSPLGWTGWISLQSKGLSRVFPTPQFKSINFLVLSCLHSPTLTSIHDHWNNHSLDQMDLCWQSLYFLICCLGWS